MLVRIIRVLESGTGHLAVEFASEVGQATARWDGLPPEEGASYEAEIDVPGVLAWGSDIVRSSPGKPAMAGGPEALELVGELEMVSPDGYTIVRVGKCMVRFRAQGRAFPIGSWVRLRARDALLCEQGL
jgi:hypothetical protein